MTTETMVAAWEMVTCSACGKHYQCTPSSDYYNNTTLEDGVCEQCLLAGHKGAKKPTAQMTPLLKAFLDAGYAFLSAELAEEMGVDRKGNPLPTHPERSPSA